MLAVSDHPSALRRYAGLAGQALARRFGAADGTGSGVDFVEAHIAYPTGLFARLLARRLRAPLVLFAHGSDVLRAPRRSGPDRVLCRWLFGAGRLGPVGHPAAPLVVANTDYLASEVQSTLDVDPRRVLVASPGIRYPDFVAASREPSVRRTRLLFVGHLIHRKAVDVLLDALATLPDPPMLRVIGEGPERSALTARARALGLERSVEFAGALDQSAVAAAMGDASVLVVPSRQEALGLVALEGMAAGCVPVVSDTGGLASTVTDGENGFLARVEDPVSLAEALERAGRAVRDPERLRALRAAADHTARSHDLELTTEFVTKAIAAALADTRTSG